MNNVLYNCNYNATLRKILYFSFIIHDMLNKYTFGGGKIKINLKDFELMIFIIYLI